MGEIPWATGMTATSTHKLFIKTLIGKIYGSAAIEMEPEQENITNVVTRTAPLSHRLAATTLFRRHPADLP